MSPEALGFTIGAVLLAAAVPYVARIRHSRQKFLAAYLIFVTVFAIVGGALFALLSWGASALGLGASLERPFPALLFFALIFVPAIVVGSWQARKPPWRRGPPA